MKFLKKIRKQPKRSVRRRKLRLLKKNIKTPIFEGAFLNDYEIIKIDDDFLPAENGYNPFHKSESVTFESISKNDSKISYRSFLDIHISRDDFERVSRNKGEQCDVIATHSGQSNWFLYNTENGSLVFIIESFGTHYWQPICRTEKIIFT